MRYFLTGCAGFIGSNFVDRLLTEGASIVGYDNFSTGKREFLAAALSSPAFQLIEGDLLDAGRVASAIQGCDAVIHLAANADVRFGPDHPTKDLEQNTLATVNVLEAMRLRGVRRIAFASTGSVYGEATVFPTPEDSPFPVQTSLYAASKLAAEGFLQAYAEAFDMQVFIFRFVSILGSRYTHGHIIDFYRQLREHPETLQILGDGHQRKSYLHVSDCIDAVLLCMEKGAGKVQIHNLGTNEYCEVNDSIDWICGHLGLNPQRVYGGGSRGWIGDNPFIFLDCARVRSLGWAPKFSIRESVIETLSYLQRALPE